ncbi:MAG: hypothetical protein ABI675_11380 [Chitinophagaceae bacterium]
MPTHLVKCVQAIREKKEELVMTLFKDPGERNLRLKTCLSGI